MPPSSPRPVRMWTQALAVAVLVSAARAESPTQLWVLQEPDRIVEYGANTLAARRTVTVPRRVLEHPEFLSINARGQMVFLPPRGMQWASGELASTGDRAWVWDGQQAREWTLEGARAPDGSTARPSVTEVTSQWLLSAGGDRLVRVEHGFEKVVEASGLERSARSWARVSRTDLGGGKPETIARLSAPGWCRCPTGTCSESCPEWHVWAPDGIVSDFFLMTRVTPGQLGPIYHESRLYQRAGATWQARTLLPGPIRTPLTGSLRGELLVAAVPDGGCCGWENDTSDQMVLVRGGHAVVLYDEWARYQNRNYDVSFYTRDARLAPGNQMLAYTLVSTAPSGSAVRLSADGTETAAERARVSEAMADLPAVEVVLLAARPRPLATIRHAGLVGWLSEREILVAQEGRLVVYDARSGARRETPIRVRTAADAFIR